MATDEKTNARGEPEAIYLQLHDPLEFDETEISDYRNSGVTWCWHKINGNDVRYIREDLAQCSVNLTALEQHATDTHSFKNFHRMLCERFNYPHDPIDWRRDQVSLMVHIDSLIQNPNAR